MLGFSDGVAAFFSGLLSVDLTGVPLDSSASLDAARTAAAPTA